MTMGDFPLKKAILSLEETVVSPQHTPTAPRTADSGPLIKRYPQSMLQETRPVITCPQNNSLIEMTDWAPPFCCFVYVTPNSLLGSYFHWINWSHLLQKSEKAMAPHSSTLAWKIPWTEEPGRLQSMGPRRVGHDWSDLAAAAAVTEMSGAPWLCNAAPLEGGGVGRPVPH